MIFISVLIQMPVYSGFSDVLTYLHHEKLEFGTLVRVPFGKQEILGIVWQTQNQVDFDQQNNLNNNENNPKKEINIRQIIEVFSDLKPLNQNWQNLVNFSANYYQRSLSEVALAAFPPHLRKINLIQLQKYAAQIEKSKNTLSQKKSTNKNKIKNKVKTKKENHLDDNLDHNNLDDLDNENHQDHLNLDLKNQQNLKPDLTDEQIKVIKQIKENPGPFLLFGSTGSGKTEIYLHSVESLLENDLQAQALVMVPEINLTPQLEERFRARFAPRWGEHALVSLHSAMGSVLRLKNWLAVHQGVARIILGTRMAVFASIPNLRLIVVDEEHDPSYKQQEGARYSARDLAIYRGQKESAKVILGSATPSLESWFHSRPTSEGGRYMRLEMPNRIGSDDLPVVRRVNMRNQQRFATFSAPLLDAIKERVQRGEQVMIFLNRRGYAPVLHCADCGWKSACSQCSAFRVFHKTDRSLRCHHCGLHQAVPKACPDCGNLDIGVIGKGTQRIEEHLAELLIDTKNQQNESVRILRIDADSTRLKGDLEKQLAQIHTGEIDVIIGTQMIAKGHDFRRVTLVAAINSDAALFSSDFRASERLFALLMQAAGRAGRDAHFVRAQNSRAEMWIQTEQPNHPLYEALKTHDYVAFAASQLKEREAAQMPPFSFQALIRAEARTQETAQGFLNAASLAANDLIGADQVMRFSAIPMSLQRVANIERAQMLIESPSRVALQRFLNAWQSVLHETKRLPEHKSIVRWAIDVDPQMI